MAWRTMLWAMRASWRPSIHDVTEVAAAEVLSHDEIAFEVEQLDLEEA